MPTAITELSLFELEELVCSYGEAKYRARQLARGIYQSQALDFAELVDLPLSLREKLSQNFRFESLSLVTRLVSSDKLTEKFLFQLKDGHTIETVAMYYPASATGKSRCTLCLSTQVGCAIGCSLLRHRPPGVRAQPEPRRNHRPGPLFCSPPG